MDRVAKTTRTPADGGTPDDGSVGVAELSWSSASNLAGDPEVTLENLGSNTFRVTIMMRNIKGAYISGRRLLRMWFSTAAYGAPAALASWSISSIVYGVKVSEPTSGLVFSMLTDSTCRAGFNISTTSDGTVYLMVSCGGAVWAKQLTITH